MGQDNFRLPEEFIYTLVTFESNTASLFVLQVILVLAKLQSWLRSCYTDLQFNFDLSPAFVDSLRNDEQIKTLCKPSHSGRHWTRVTTFLPRKPCWNLYKLLYLNLFLCNFYRKGSVHLPPFTCSIWSRTALFFSFLLKISSVVPNNLTPLTKIARDIIENALR